MELQKWIEWNEFDNDRREFWNRLNGDFVSNKMPERVTDGVFMFACHSHPVGVAQIIDYEDRGVSWIQTVFVDHRVRNGGVATKLVQDCCRYGEQKRLTVGMGVRTWNKPMIRVAKKCGFVQNDTYEDGKVLAFWKYLERD